VLANLSMNDTITWIESSFFFALAWSVCSTGTAPVREKLDVLVQELMAGPMSDEMFQLTGMQVDRTIAIIKDVNYIAQGHRCATSAQMAVWLRNCLCLYSYLHN